MTFSTKIIRCHILDRQDQLSEAIYWQKCESARTTELEKDIIAAQERLEKHKQTIEERQKHIEYLESTMNIRWIDNPPY